MGTCIQEWVKDPTWRGGSRMLKELRNIRHPELVGMSWDDVGASTAHCRMIQAGIIDLEEMEEASLSHLLSTRQVAPGTNKMPERDCHTWSYIRNITSIYKNFVNMNRKPWKHLGLIYLWACSCVINQIVVGMSNPESWNSPARHFLRWCKYPSWNTLPTKNSPQSFFPNSQRPWPSHMSSSLGQLLTYSQWRAQGCNCQTLFVALWCTWSCSCQWEGGCPAWWGVPDCGTKYFSVQLHLPRRNNDPVCQTQWCPLSAET